MALLALAVLLASISGLIGLATVTRIAVEDATNESLLVTQTLLLQIGRVVRDAPEPITALRTDERIALVLQAATAQAPAVVFAAICDSSETAITHTMSERVGARLDPLPALPKIDGFWDALRFLGRLLGTPQVFELRTPLLLGGTPFASIRVGIAGVLIRERADEVFRRGLLTASAQLAIAGAIGFLLARITARRFRQLEVGVAAMREGRFEKIPEAGVDEFSRLARDLNLLSAQFQKERLDRDSRIGQINQTVDHLGKGVITLGPDRKIVLINNPAARVLGIDPGSSRGRNIEDLLPARHPVLELAARALDDAEDGLSVDVASSPPQQPSAAIAHLIPGFANRQNGVLIEFREAAAMRELHRLVDQSRILSRLGQMAIGVAHEIRNPLQAISFEVAALQEIKDLGREEIDKRVGAIGNEIQRLQRAVSGFLKIARLREPTYEAVQLNELLEDLRQSMQAQADLAGLAIEFDCDPNLPESMCDRGVVNQAVENLITNATQALPSASGRIVIASRYDCSGIRISITDTGPGIRKEHLDKVCELYFTTKVGGSGVGLALVRQAVEMHGGEIKIDSRVGAGTSITLMIPYRPVGETA
jgi:signal transduction histidine kinase